MTGPRVGEVICTCQMAHVRIVEVDDDGDTITTEDGWRCSYRHCCDPADHEWAHDEIHQKADDHW